jgi:hypothetical protein
MIYFYERKLDNGATYIFMDFYPFMAMKVLGTLQVIFTGLMLLFWVFIYLPMIIEDGWSNYVESNKPKAQKKLDEEII